MNFFYFIIILPRYFFYFIRANYRRRRRRCRCHTIIVKRPQRPAFKSTKFSPKERISKNKKRKSNFFFTLHHGTEKKLGSHSSFFFALITQLIHSLFLYFYSSFRLSHLFIFHCHVIYNTHTILCWTVTFI